MRVPGVEILRLPGSDGLRMTGFELEAALGRRQFALVLRYTMHHAVPIFPRSLTRTYAWSEVEWGAAELRDGRRAHGVGITFASDGARLGE
jgi:hypothetical protein